MFLHLSARRRRVASALSRWAIGVVTVAAPGLASAQQSPAPARAKLSATTAAVASFALRGVTIVDVREGRLLPDQTVMVVGTRIESVGPKATVTIPAGTRSIDATGRFVIPGLWDMHVHTWDYPDVVYPLAIANGVTGVRDMWHEDVRTLIGWRQEIANGERVGPRIFGTGPFLGGHNAETPAQAVADIRELKADGADFIKVRDGLSRKTYFAALAEARRLRIPLVGHLSAGVAMREASDSGQRTVEHEVACPADATTEAQCAALAAALRRNGTWITPTTVAYLYLVGGVAPERLRFWPDAPDVGAFTGSPVVPTERSAGERQAAKDNLTAGLATLVRAGMPLLAGTDAGPLLPEDTPGFSLHEELAWFVKAGMTPAAALRTATLDPALALQATDSLGTVTPGKLADLVVLTADPLADIANLDKIDAVVANGRYFARAQLDVLIADVERRGRNGPDAVAAQRDEQGESP